jgi:hypothetical protein
MAPRWLATLRHAPRRSITARLALAIGVSSLLATLLQAALFAWTTRTRLEAEAGKALADSAVQLSTLLERGLFERSREVQTFAMLPLVTDPAAPVARKAALLEQLQGSFLDYA